MKTPVTQFFSLALTATIIYGNINTVNETKGLQLPAILKNAGTASPAWQDDGIVGDWKLSLEAYDDNHNKQLDDAERKKGFSNHYFYRFSADGSCIISPFVNNQLKSGFKGHYALAEKNGEKILTTYWDEAEQKGQREAQYMVIAVNKDELVLLETTGDHTFWIFKRVG